MTKAATNGSDATTEAGEFELAEGIQTATSHDETLDPQRQVALFEELQAAIQQRQALEQRWAACAQSHPAGQMESALAEVERQQHDEQQRLADDEAAAFDAIAQRFDSDLAQAEAEYRRELAETEETFREKTEETNRRAEDARWEAVAVLDAARNALSGETGGDRAWLHEQASRLSELGQECDRLAREVGLQGEEARKASAAPATIENPVGGLTQALEAAVLARNEIVEFRRHPILRALWLVPVFVAVFVMLTLGVRMAAQAPVFELQGWPWLAGIGGVTLAVGLLVALVRRMLRRQTLAELHAQWTSALSAAEASYEICKQHVDSVLQRRLAEAEKQHERELARLRETARLATAKLAEQRQQRVAQIEKQYSQALPRLRSVRDRDMATAQQQFDERRTASQRTYRELRGRLEREYREAAAVATAERQRAADELRDFWRLYNDHLRNEVSQIHQADERRFPPWLETSWSQWQSWPDVPGGIRFGEYEVDLRSLPGAWPEASELQRLTLDRFRLPALAPFPRQASLLLKAQGDGRQAAAQTLQTVTLRLLTGLPAGKVRLTIIDPLGLGENFAGFMHLADYDELLITSRIWTEAEHIERRLSDLTEHLENVIQTYLRNEFETIEEYNRDAGEVAEPFRFLIVANFPANFSEAAVKRLAAIASSGPRCGIYTLISVDTRQKLPPNCSLRDLEQHCQVLKWEDGRFRWMHDVLGQFPLQLDAPPPADVFSTIVHAAGRNAKDAHRVQVPFAQAAPPEDRWWQDSTAAELNGSLGKVGATKLQSMRLGRGTSQHVLIAGKTGSGKSTLLHVLITSLALRYSPQELQFYLIDFKKGVEFKTYAAHRLPHARVVAVESEREFGLSVLQRLDLELKLRGEAFRDVGAQDLAAYRQASGKTLPRLLLIVDEFQELFVEDDRTSQDAALLLDRLVRQGRAFGIHILLGSQTLGGAYSLARSTLGQMAVRIALECSETDASLILSEGNTAARLLSRPGEAIYNDANGRIEGNKPFQIAWLADEERERYLHRIRSLAEKNGLADLEQIVFEGNSPADPAKNYRLREAFDRSSPPAVPVAWLGEPVAIKDPTAVPFRRQGGSNLLVVGQREEAAAAILTMSIISLAAQHRPRSLATQGSQAPAESASGAPSTGDAASGSEKGSGAAEFYILDGSQPDAPQGDLFARLQAMAPHPTTLASWRETATVMDAVATELDRRIQGVLYDEPAIYLWVFNVGRIRDLRRDESDFGYSRYGEEEAPPSPAKRFAQILKEGAAFGVHILLWSDTLTSLQRVFDRTALREFEQRVVFQMGPDDSSHLIDTPAASKLGPFRALYYSEEVGQAEKFRPYQLPSSEWLEQVAKRWTLPNPSTQHLPAQDPPAQNAPPAPPAP